MVDDAPMRVGLLVLVILEILQKLLLFFEKRSALVKFREPAKSLLVEVVDLGLVVCQQFFPLRHTLENNEFKIIITILPYCSHPIQ